MSRRTKEEKRAEAEARQALRNNRSDKEQYDKLRAAGHTHCKEATKIFGRMLVRYAANQEAEQQGE